jgi:hypothetical protein
MKYKELYGVFTMCDILLSKKAMKTLKSIGCTRDRFLRLSSSPDVNACLDTQMHPTDEVLLETPDLRIVSSATELNALDGIRICFDPALTFSR